ncbi:hypothetical protein GUJ93_ZPchr0006g42483 [Zizania palustris]|uniref:Uncharacterized protein n=1 Tax=Zizania palustris TaxID=103762 RepID=A0A8J5SQM9_ZIZPA|nr:hypothetical protein GUJ93_ZPchr0006g42483 [Zizania palustris]
MYLGLLFNRRTRDNLRSGSIPVGSQVSPSFLHLLSLSRIHRVRSPTRIASDRKYKGYICTLSLALSPHFATNRQKKVKKTTQRETDTHTSPFYFRFFSSSSLSASAASAPDTATTALAAAGSSESSSLASSAARLGSARGRLRAWPLAGGLSAGIRRLECGCVSGLEI